LAASNRAICAKLVLGLAVGKYSSSSFTAIAGFTWVTPPDEGVALEDGDANGGLVCVSPSIFGRFNGFHLMAGSVTCTIIQSSSSESPIALFSILLFLTNWKGFLPYCFTRLEAKERKDLELELECKRSKISLTHNPLL
jgi:hypothetical protein